MSKMTRKGFIKALSAVLDGKALECETIQAIAKTMQDGPTDFPGDYTIEFWHCQGLLVNFRVTSGLARYPAEFEFLEEPEFDIPQGRVRLEGTDDYLDFSDGKMKWEHVATVRKRGEVFSWIGREPATGKVDTQLRPYLQGPL